MFTTKHMRHEISMSIAFILFMMIMIGIPLLIPHPGAIPAIIAIGLSVLAYPFIHFLLETFTKDKYINKSITFEIRSSPLSKITYGHGTIIDYQDGLILKYKVQTDDQVIWVDNWDVHEIREQVVKSKTIKKRKKGSMPRIFKYALYAALVFIVWRFVLNIEHIVAFVVELL